MTVTIDEIKKKCSDERYFAYDSLQDRLFVPIAMYLVWLFVRIGVSGNAVSWLSALAAVLGAFLLTSSDSLVVLIGSFGYILWCLLDYVDGVVARFNGKGSVAGQYIDWIMHVIAHIAIIAGIAFGAMNSVGAWIYPFAILGMVAAGLTYAKFSMAWFAICMEQQQRRASSHDVQNRAKTEIIMASGRLWLWFDYIRRLTVVIFHENWLIFTLPLLAIAQFFQVFGAIDFRVVFTIVAGSLYFPVQVLEIHRLVITKRVERGYSELFSDNHIPKLPNDHFLK
ncbi:CDP-alcohol phosphatidyltransferase family protein [bacterium]|nr:CDP-alcohol phosphatidyltransferase family protein [bacterium]